MAAPVTHQYYYRPDDHEYRPYAYRRYYNYEYEYDGRSNAHG